MTNMMMEWFVFLQVKPMLGLWLPMAFSGKGWSGRLSDSTCGDITFDWQPDQPLGLGWGINLSNFIGYKSQSLFFQKCMCELQLRPNNFHTSVCSSRILHVIYYQHCQSLVISTKIWCVRHQLLDWCSSPSAYISLGKYSSLNPFPAALLNL